MCSSITIITIIITIITIIATKEVAYAAIRVK